MRKYVSVFCVSARQQLRYLGAFAARNVFFLIILFVFFSLWRVVYTGRATIAGLTMTQTLWYLTFNEAVELSRSRAFSNIQDEVKDGTIAYLLARPYAYASFKLARFLGESLVCVVPALVVEFLCAFALAGYLPGYVRALPFGLLLIAGGIILGLQWQIIIGLPAFWTEEVSPFHWIVQKLVFIMGGMFFPIDFFPDWLQTVSKASPFAFAAYRPAITMVRFDSSTFATGLLGQLGYIAVFGQRPQHWCPRPEGGCMSKAVEQKRRRRWTKVPGLALHYMRFNLAAGMEYRASFVVQVFGMVLNNSAFIIFWLILFEKLDSPIRGYAFTDVMFLWALAAAGFGLAGVTMGNAGNLSRIVYSGELDVYLLQPVSVLPNVVASRMSVSAWGDLAYGFILFAATQPLTPLHIGLFLVFTVLAAIVFTSLRILYHTLTFFLGNAEAFAGMASEVVLSFVLYPGSIFHGPTLWLLHSLLPAALVAYIPARLFHTFDAGTFALLIAADACIVVAAWLLFTLGLRRYESGNRMGIRL